MKQTTTLLLGTVAFVGSLSVASNAIGASASHLYPSHGRAHSPFSCGSGTIYGTLYDQNKNDEHVAIVSQNFTSGSFAAYDSQGADDFIVPYCHTWTIMEVDVTGTYVSGSGPATSETVYLYKYGANGLPGPMVWECDDVHGKRVSPYGSFRIRLPAECQIPLTKPIRYWTSVQINMPAYRGEWEWEKQTHVYGNPAAWQNPGDGFGTGCTTWAVENTCWGLSAPAPTTGDKMYAIKGKDVSTP